MSLSSIAHYHQHWDQWERCRESECGFPIWDRWLCTKRIKVRNEDRYLTCGEPYYYRRTLPGTVAGPFDRRLDRRYGYGGGWRCKHDSKSLLRHESAPDPNQPIQDDLLYEQIEELKVVAKAARRKRGRKKASPA